MTNVVVGAGSGMGTAVARALAPRGRLIAADRNLAAVAAVAAELGGDVTPVECDVTDAGQIDAMVKSIDDLDAIVLRRRRDAGGVRRHRRGPDRRDGQEHR
jgi:NADP-dependent 3-hydroxy acid dehydrogenase YdfG